jgi:protein-disulfide isomerase
LHHFEHHHARRVGRSRRAIFFTALAAGIFIAVGATVGREGRIASALGAVPNPDPVLATVGNHQITEQQVDQEILKRILRSVDSSKLYEWRKDAVNGMVDQYLIDKAAKKAGLPPDQYVAHEINADNSNKVTEADARKYYDGHKAQIQAQTTRPFDQIKGELIAALQRQQNTERREQLMAKLKAEEPVKIMLVEPRVKVESEGHPSTGGKDAPVTIVEFSDFQCPFCRAAENSLKAVKDRYGDKVRLVYLDFPLGMHAHAMDAARAGRCAGEQGKFWQFHDIMFADQSKLTPADLKADAKNLGLDTKAFDTCFDSNKYDAEIHKDMSQGTTLGVTATPTFYINGRQVLGAQPPDRFDEVIDEELAQQKGSNKQSTAKN